MKTERQLKDQSDRLQQMVQDVLNSNTMSNDQKKTKLEALSTEVRAHDTEMKNRRAAAEMRARLGNPGDYEDPANLRKSQSGFDRSRSQLTSAKDLQPDQLEGILKSATSGSVYRTTVVQKDFTIGGIPAPGVPAQMLAPAGLALDPTRIAALLPTQPIEAGTVEYLQWLPDVSEGTGPAYTPEATLKPTVGVKLAAKTATAEKLAGILKLSDELVKDFSLLYETVPTELSRLLTDAENGYLLNGRTIGTGQSATLATAGLRNAAGILTYSVPSKPAGYVGSQGLDAISTGIANLRNGPAYANADSLIISPTTYAALTQAKNTQGEYLAGQPANEPVPTLWGLPVVVTTEASDGEAILFDSTKAAKLFIREAVRVEADASGDNFVYNTVTFRVEERLALGVVNTPAILKITGITG